MSTTSPRACRDGGADGRALAPVLLVEEDADVRMGERTQQLPGAVGGAVVDDEKFLVVGSGQDALENLLDRLAFVVDRNHHGQ